MATNAWIEGYIDALMRAGEPVGEPIHGAPAVDADRRLYANYYVQQILRWDEDGIRRAWSKANASAGRNPADKDYRLAYLTWRVWFMRQKLAKVAAEEAQRGGATDFDASDLGNVSELDSTLDAEEEVPPSPGGNASPPSPPASPRLQDIRPGVRLLPLAAPKLAPLPQALPALLQGPPLYLVLISLHGLVRGNEMELGRDADTGGQVKYVVELSRALAKHPGVHRVDLLTRLITDPSVDGSYGVPEESLDEEQDASQGGGAYIVRLAAGNSDVYLRKELLWPFIREYADRAIEYVCKKQAELEQVHGQACRVVCMHAHYADGAEIACMMGSTLGTIVAVTGHSLGRNKLENILKGGKLTRSETEAQYRIGRRIEAEERALDGADVIFTSTVQEIDSQWGLYDGYDASLHRALMRSRRVTGRWVPRMAVIPPGVDFARVKPVDLDTLPEGDGEPPIWKEIARFLRNPRKPAILALARPDAKKNLHTLIRAYGENNTLRELANLVIFAGNRDSVDAMALGAKRVMEGVLKLVDALDLYGSVALPKHHAQQDVSDIYAFAASTRGAFVNIALQEPFGLVLIEAAAHGLPTVATRYGGPVEIHSILKNGLLVEPTDASAVADALVTLLTDRHLWESCRNSGLEHIHEFSWEAHCHRYFAVLDETLRQSQSLAGRQAIEPADISGAPVELVEAPPSQRMLVLTMDSRDAQQAAKLLQRALACIASRALHLDTVAVVVASALSAKDTLSILEKAGVLQGSLHAVVTDAGARILIHAANRQDLVVSEEWQKHISLRWLRAVALRAVLQAASGAVVLSPDSNDADATPFLLRFSLAEGATAIPALHVMMRRLRRRGVRLTLHYSAGAWELRALPLRASRALAVRYLAQRRVPALSIMQRACALTHAPLSLRSWGVPLEKAVVLADTSCEPDGDRAAVLEGLVSCVLVGGAPPPSPRTATRSTAPELSVSPDDLASAAAHINRSIWLEGDDDLDAALVTALARKEE